MLLSHYILIWSVYAELVDSVGLYVDSVVVLLPVIVVVLLFQALSLEKLLCFVASAKQSQEKKEKKKGFLQIVATDLIFETGMKFV